MKLSIIIVSWNVCDKLQTNLKAIFSSQATFEFEVFVVDNNSQDETVAMIKADFPQVKLIANQDNLGFAKANNQAIREATGEFILLLNPDMKPFVDTFENMVSWFDKHPTAKIAGCQLVNEQGEIVPHVRRFPRVTDQAAIILKLPHIFPAILNRYLCSDFDYRKEGVVDSVRGSFFMLRRPPNGLPLLDERYFVWFEEVDYCKQITSAGGEIWYTPAAKCVDLIGASFSQVKRGKTQEYFRDSMLAYFAKWHPRWQYQLLRMLWPIGRIMVKFGGLFKYV